MLRVGLALALVSVLGGPPPVMAAPGQGPGDHPKLDRKLNDRDRNEKGGTSRAIILLKSGQDASGDVAKLGGKLGRRLALMNGLAVELPNKVLRKLADNPAVERIVWDRPLDSTMNRVAVTVGARAVQDTLGYTGAGIGVAVIDSGITAWHDDLTYQGRSTLVKVKNGQRVSAFVDFVGGRLNPYDDYGHGTHVAGIIAGNGYDTFGSRAGIAPDANLVGLKVLDGNGRGVISNVIAAIEWAITNRAAYNIRVINLSVGSSITESYNTDPLALAAKRAVDAGIVVVAAAGNLGKNATGQVAVRRHHRAGQRPLGPDRRRVEHRRHGVAAGRRVCAVQLTGPVGHRLPGQAGSSRPRHGRRVAERCDQPAVPHQPRPAPQWPAGQQAVYQPVGHQHGCAGRRRHGGADAPGESVAHAEPGQGGDSVHRAGVSRLQRPDAGSRVPEHEGRRRPGALLQDGPGGSAPPRAEHVEPHAAVGQPPPAGRHHQAERDAPGRWVSCGVRRRA